MPFDGNNSGSEDGLTVIVSLKRNGGETSTMNRLTLDELRAIEPKVVGDHLLMVIGKMLESVLWRIK